LSSTDTDTPAIPGDTLRAGLVDELRNHIGTALLDSLVKPGDDVWVRVAPTAWLDTAMALKQMGFTYFGYLSAIDWMPSPFGKGEDDPTAPAPERDDTIKQGYAGGETRFQMIARVHSIARGVGIHIKADVEDRGSIDSWIPAYAGANWHERECCEMFGINFTGHPDLRKMYLPGDFEGNPLRKDFPLLSRMIKPWPGIVDVEPMPGSDAEDDE
jgi:NADH-quinone oxidoreductase subunit C